MRPLWPLVTLVVALAAGRAPAQAKQGGAAAQEGAAGRKESPSTMASAGSALEMGKLPMTRAQGAEIIRELDAIRLLLRSGAAKPAGTRGSPGAPRKVKMQVSSGWQTIGRADAPVTMIEFTDLQCPFCRRFQTTTFPQIKKDYIDTGKVRFVAMDFPLPMHQYAMGAAEAAACAGSQGKFWKFRDDVLNDQVPPTPVVLSKHAKDLGLDLDEFQNCLKGNKYQDEIQNEQVEARAVGVVGTPAFVIGRTDAGWVKGVLVTGARPLAYFKGEISSTLRGSPSGLSGTRVSAGNAENVPAPSRP